MFSIPFIENKQSNISVLEEKLWYLSLVILFPLLQFPQYVWLNLVECGITNKSELLERFYFYSSNLHISHCALCFYCFIGHATLMYPWKERVQCASACVRVPYTSKRGKVLDLTHTGMKTGECMCVLCTWACYCMCVFGKFPCYLHCDAHSLPCMECFYLTRCVLC